MKSILLSIKPKYVELIASGEKTIEVRKTRPKLETPFKCYIYCTKGESLWLTQKGVKLKTELSGYLLNGKVIGEFVCDRVTEYKAEFTDLHYFNAMGKSVALNEIKRVAGYDEDGEPKYYYETSNEEENPDDCKLLKESCLTFNELRQYTRQSRTFRGERK